MGSRLSTGDQKKGLAVLDIVCTLDGDKKVQKPRRNRQREADGTGQQRVSGLGADPQEKCRIPETGTQRSGSSRWRRETERNVRRM